jgi:hypothetical protein
MIQYKQQPFLNKIGNAIRINQEHYLRSVIDFRITYHFDNPFTTENIVDILIHSRNLIINQKCCTQNSKMEVF